MNSVPLGEIVDFYSGGTPSKAKPEFWSGNVPWFSAKDMKHRRLVDSANHVSETVFTGTPLRKLPAGTVALVVRGMILAHTVPISVLEVDAAINQDLKALLPKREIVPSFLASMLRAQQSEILARVSTAAHGTKKLDSRVLEEIRVPLPSVPEQRRIAAIFDRAEDFRRKRQQLMSHLESLAEAIFHETFDSFPANATVEEVADPAKASIRTGPFGSQLLHGEFVDQGVAVLGLDNVVSNDFRWAGRRFITSEKYKQLTRYTVRPGDVLISIMGTTGRCVVVPDDIPTAINTKHICAITVDADRVTPNFLRAVFLWHPESREHLRRQTKGSIMSGLNMGIIKAMPVPVVKLDLQAQFDRRITAIESLRRTVISAQEADEELFHSLEARALRGGL